MMKHTGKVPLMSLKKVTQFLDCSERTMHRYIVDKKIRAYKYDGMLKFNPADIEAFLRRRGVGYGKAEPFADASNNEVEKIIAANKAKYYAMTDGEADDWFTKVKLFDNSNLAVFDVGGKPAEVDPVERERAVQAAWKLMRRKDKE